MEEHINLQNKTIPPSFDGNKISVVNDIYLNNSNDSKILLNNTINKINEINANYFVLNGGLLDPNDITNINLNEKELVNTLLKIHAKQGKFATFSKEEKQNQSLFEELKNIYTKSGFIILDNINYDVYFNNENEHINFLNYEKDNNTELKSNDKIFTIAFSNLPDYVLQLKNSKVNYYIHGNTLGGLINLPFAQEIFPLIKNLKSSLSQNKYNNTTVIENTGIGTRKIPIRIWNNPKVFVLHLLSKE